MNFKIALQTAYQEYKHLADFLGINSLHDLKDNPELHDKFVDLANYESSKMEAYYYLDMKLESILALPELTNISKEDMLKKVYLGTELKAQLQALIDNCK